MNEVNKFVNNLYNILVGNVPKENETLIKVHTCSLEELGDLSFPLPRKNWHRLINISKEGNEKDTIFSYKLNISDLADVILYIKEKGQNLNVKIQCSKIIKHNVHIFFERTQLFALGILQALNETENYGSEIVFEESFQIVENLHEKENVDLTGLRGIILKNVIETLLHFTCKSITVNNPVRIAIKESNKLLITEDSSVINILCGPVLNEKGVKDLNTKSVDLFEKRATDMRLMAQHRYRLKINNHREWNDYFEKLARASATIELLSNKPQKSLKVTLNNLSGANKGPAFIFYNCARLSMLLKEFDNRVKQGIYSNLPDINKIDFKLLKQPEEWELLYVYILQFPNVIKNCIRSIKIGIVNPQYLITFLSNLSSLFSVYYRRVKILTEGREHLIAILHCRISLLKALQIVFHNSLGILNIEPIKEM